MTNETKQNGQEENLEREAFVAKQRIASILLPIKNINDRLEQIYNLLYTNININEVTSIVDITKMKKNPDSPIFYKKRNKLKNTPDMLWFKMHGIYYYIDFTIQCVKNDKNNQLEGCFIYGTSYYIEKDKVEDKPIVSFFIDNHDIIKANNDFENESWTCKKEHIIDLHLRTLDKIWEEALYLINKDKF